LGQVQRSQRFIHLPRNLAIEAMESLTEVNDTRLIARRWMTPKQAAGATVQLTQP
jgi:hypothetical protein